MPRERTFIMIRPETVKRGLVGKISSRFEEKGFKLVNCSACRAERVGRIEI